MYKGKVLDTLANHLVNDSKLENRNVAVVDDELLGRLALLVRSPHENSLTILLTLLRCVVAEEGPRIIATAGSPERDRSKKWPD